MVALTVNLSRGNSNQLAEAVLLDLEQRHVDDFQTDWVASLRQSAQDDKYWDWVFKQRAATNYGNYECYAIEAEGRTQGLMMIETLWHRSQVAVGQPLVYVEALSVAPWNRLQIQRPPYFKRVGSVLLEFSRTRSEALGYEGRVGLQSLPGAEGFYESRNMMRFEPEIDDFIDDDEPLTYFEYPPLRNRES